MLRIKSPSTDIACIPNTFFSIKGTYFLEASLSLLVSPRTVRRVMGGMFDECVISAVRPPMQVMFAGVSIYDTAYDLYTSVIDKRPPGGRSLYRDILI